MTRPPTQYRHVRVLGHDVRVAVRAGTAPGPPLVLCNGIGASLELLQPFVDAVDERIEVVRFDVPGAGGSPTPRVPYTFPMLAGFVARVLDRLGYRRFDVLGLSWGGGLAQQLAFQYPRRCRRVVLVSTGTGMLMVPARLRVLGTMLTPRRHRDPAFARHIAPVLYGGRMRQGLAEVSRVMSERPSRESTAGYYLQLLAGVGWSSLPALPLVRQPTLILTGHDDPLIPVVNGRIMRALLPHASLHVFDDGHLGLVTSAHDLGPLVSDFLVADNEAGDASQG